jgi:hypothetical protein
MRLGSLRRFADHSLARLRALVRKLAEGIRLVLRNFVAHPLKATAALVGFLVAVTSLTFGIQRLVNWIWPEYRSTISRLIIVDASQSMTRRFSPQSKFASVQDEVLRAVEQQPKIDFALRFTSKTCGKPYEKPAVDFDHENAKAIKAKLQSVKLGGQSTFGDAVQVGVNDFLNSKTASSAKTRTIWLLLGTATDDCASSRGIAQNLKRALGESAVTLSWIDFFALKSEEKSFEKLERSVAAALSEKVAVSIVRVDNAKMLQKKLDEASFRERPSD